jgi:DNA-binding LacI/PurR family transcriptional regulator
MNKKRISIKDVAELAGVSYQTVSKVLNGQNHVSAEKVNRIHSAAAELGYRVNRQARNLRTQRAHMIGYSWRPDPPGQANHILDTFLTSMVQEADEAGYHFLPFPYREGHDDQIRSYRELIDAGQVDGFVISSVIYDDPRVRFLQEQSVPFVAFGHFEADSVFPWVDVDGEAGVRMATEHLLARGHRRIALLGWPEDSRVGNERARGYFTALQAAGVVPDAAWVHRGEGSFEMAYEMTEHLLQLEADRRPTAIVAVSDTMAIGAIHAGQTRGLTVGRDLAVVGFDDAPMAQYLWPPLTTVRQPIREVGHQCVGLLLALLTGQAPAQQQLMLSPKLVVRASG